VGFEAINAPHIETPAGDFLDADAAEVTVVIVHLHGDHTPAGRSHELERPTLSCCRANAEEKRRHGNFLLVRVVIEAVVSDATLQRSARGLFDDPSLDPR